MACCAGLKGGLAAIASTFKKLALVLDHSTEDEHGGSSTGNSPVSCSSDGGGISISPVPTPKDGSSKLRAFAYKQHHGYLPSPTASSGGALSRAVSSKSIAGSSLSCATSNRFAELSATSPSDAQAATSAAAAAQMTDAGRVLSAAGATLAKAAVAANSLQVSPTAAAVEDALGLQPLPPGAVPTFGPAGVLAGAAAASTAAAHESTVRFRGCVLLAKDFGAGLGNPSGDSAASMSPKPSSSAPLAVDGAADDVKVAASTAAVPLKLGPASLPGPLLLGVSQWLPRSMQRDTWCLADFVVQKKLYEGYASVICKVSIMCMHNMGHAYMNDIQGMHAWVMPQMMMSVLGLL